MTFDKHRFGVDLTDRVVARIKRFGSGLSDRETESAWSARAEKSLTRADEYDQACLFAFGDVLTAENRISLATALYTKSPARFRLPPAVSAYHVWLDYHLTQFVAGLVTLADTMLILTATVANLGLAPRECTRARFRKQEALRGTGLEEQLHKFLDAVERHRDARNRIIHRAELATLATYIGEERANFAHGVSLVAADASDGEWKGRLRLTWKYMVKAAAPKQIEDWGSIRAECDELLDVLADLAIGMRATFVSGARRVRSNL